MQLPDSQTLRAHVQGDLVYYTFPQIEAIPFVRHGFSTRLGGVSEGIFSSMNLSFTRGDDPQRVRENFERFCAAIGGSAEQVVISAQEHHTAIRNVTREDAGRGVTRDRGWTDVDGLLTDEPGVILCTQYADCVPLFFVDPVKRVVGTSHSGWKGTVARIGAVTVERMCRDYGCRPEDILAGIGPSIGPCCFEVDTPVYEAFSQMDLWEEGFVRHRGEKHDLDLWSVNRKVLEQAGLLPEHITVTDVCTRCYPEVFWSHRATGGNRGSLAAFIALAR